MKRIFFLYSVSVLVFGLDCFAHDNEVIHRNVTSVAMSDSQLGLHSWLNKNLNFSDGLVEIFSSAGKSQTAEDWLKEGSYLEDIDTDRCRATNHFHNPLLPWKESRMTDQPWLLNFWCLDWKPWYSNVTWATGYLEPPPDGAKATFTRESKYAPNTWNNARYFYHQALTATEQTKRDSAFAMTFRALGQVSHLLQDMAVPAHVRNDLASHYACKGGDCGNHAAQWLNNNFEFYVERHPNLVTTAAADPIQPTLVKPRLTDFWDTNQYDGTNPSLGFSQGLAEYTNANFFSDSTISSNLPDEEHAFPYPKIDAANYQVCEENELGSTTPKKKYIYRKSGAVCPPLEAPRSADRRAIASLLNQEDAVTNENISRVLLRLDDNVHDAYARALLPPAIGYTSQLLGYFFRGRLDVKMMPVFNSEQILNHINLKIRNVSSSQETMSGARSRFFLTYAYRPEGGAPGENAYNRTLGDMALPKDLLYGKDTGGNDLSGEAFEIDMIALDFPDRIPEERYPELRFMLSFLGDLGDEKMDFAVNRAGEIGHYGAVIGRALAAKPLRHFHEEWTGSSGEYTWFQMDSDLFGSNRYADGVDHGLVENLVQDGRLTKRNLRFAEGDNPYGPLEGSHANTSLIGYHALSGDQYANGLFPIPITRDTYVQFKIDEMSIEPQPEKSANLFTHHQGVELVFNNGYILQLSLNDQNWWDGESAAYFTFSAGDLIVDNIHDMFRQWNMPIPADFKLERIVVIQQIGYELPRNVEYQQRMVVDFFRVIEMESGTPN